MIYCCWCDEEGKIIDDGTITRLEENRYRWTAADPNLRWFRQNAIGFEVQIEDITEQVAALALQGPTSGRLLKSVAEAEIENLKYFRKTSGKIGGVPVDISRTGYTGDLGYEIWIAWQDAVKVWDALMEAGRSFDIHPTGMLALDVARIEAGLILADVDYISSKKALIPSQKYTPAEVGLGQAGALREGKFHRQARAAGREEDRAEACAGGTRNRLERSGSALRQNGTCSADARHRVARARAGVQGAGTSRQGDVDDLVSVTEAVDCVGQRGTAVCAARHQAANGSDGGSGQAQGCGHSTATAVLQSAAQDQDAGLSGSAATRGRRGNDPDKNAALLRRSLRDGC